MSNINHSGDSAYYGRLPHQDWIYVGKFSTKNNKNLLGVMIIRHANYEVFVHKFRPLWCHKEVGELESRGGGKMKDGRALYGSYWINEWINVVNEVLEKALDPSVSPNSR